MTFLNQFRTRLVDSYRWATLPYRHLTMRQAKRAGRVPIAILFYHRVADDRPNPWTIGTLEFKSQIDWLSRNFDLVSLEEVQRRMQSGYNDRPTVSITFDDGYADNATFALPLLVRRNIPVTYFVTTGPTIGQSAFPHDLRAGFHLETNTLEMIRAFADSGIEIGAHTRTHADLGKITDSQRLIDEVSTATKELASHLDRPIRYFAFPFGQFENLNAKAFRIARDYGFLGVCSAFGGWNEIGDDGFHLHRFHGDPRLARVKNWLTLDPRKRHSPHTQQVERMMRASFANREPQNTSDLAAVEN